MTLMQWNTLGALHFWLIPLVLVIGERLNHKRGNTEAADSFGIAVILFTVVALIVTWDTWPQIGQAWFGVQK